MQMSGFDDLFRFANSGDKDAYWELYQKFVDKAYTITIRTIKTTKNYPGIYEDFCGIIDELFFKAIKEYNPEKAPFSAFIDYILNTRLVMAVKKYLSELAIFTTDYIFDNSDIKSIELVGDPNQKTMPVELALRDFKARVASPNNKKSQREKLYDRVLLLQYAGYPNNEISRILNMSYSTLRRLLKEIKTDVSLNNIKLDLK